MGGDLSRKGKEKARDSSQSPREVSEAAKSSGDEANSDFVRAQFESRAQYQRDHAPHPSQDHGGESSRQVVPYNTSHSRADHQPRFIPFGAAVPVSGWMAYENNVGVPQRTAAASSIASQVHARMTDTQIKLNREYDRLQKRGKLKEATRDQLNAHSIYKTLYRKLHPTIKGKEKENKINDRDTASHMRAFLARREGIDIVARHKRNKESNETPGTVYRAAVKKGYEKSQPTLERKSERYYKDRDNYQDTSDEEKNDHR